MIKAIWRGPAGSNPTFGMVYPGRELSIFKDESEALKKIHGENLEIGNPQQTPQSTTKNKGGDKL